MKKPAKGTGKRAAPKSNKAGPVTAQKKAAPLQFSLRSAGAQPIQIHQLDSPLRYERRDRIQPRRILPRVIEGRERDFHSVSPQIEPRPTNTRGVSATVAVNDVVLRVNTELNEPALKGMACNVGEPSVAANKDVVLFTGNWYTARSIDGGQTFQYIDPFTSFPNPPNLSFCCDQVANYIPSIDTFVWLLQYGVVSGPQADNIQRLAFAKTADVAVGRWRLFDVTTQGIGVAGQFMDFPDLSVGANSLYVTTNLFTPTGQSSGSAVLRIPFASIESGQVVATPFVSTELNSFRVAQNCGSQAFFAAHKDTSTLQVFTWDESKAAPVPSLVEVSRWIGGAGYHSRTPDGRTWLDRADPRMTGATLAGSDLYFGWGVNSGSNQRPQPFIQIARIDAKDLTLIENINIFDPDSATCYGALSTNADNEVGISYIIGGGPRYPTFMAGILTGTRKDVVVAVGERGPVPNATNGGGEWGDYLAVRPVYPDRKLFAAAGYTMKGSGDGTNRDATPRYVVFGRAQVAGAGVAVAQSAPVVGALFSSPPMADVPTPPSKRSDGPPITDVNALNVVNAAVAGKIKAAAGLVLDANAPAARAEPAAPAVEQQDTPGTERWHVKTGQDSDRAKVGKNVVNGEDLGAGIVESTVEELASLPRPPGLENLTGDPPEFQDVRDGVTEVTIWRIEAKIISLKHEKDGDYHLVLQGPSGQEMIAEVPTPTQVFVGDSPWINNFAQARQEIDDKLVRRLAPASFALVQGKFMPQGAVTFQPRAAADVGLSFVTPPAGSGATQPLFQSAIPPTPVRITGVGFFDKAHGATGAAPNVVEIHPILKVEWL